MAELFTLYPLVTELTISTRSKKPLNDGIDRVMPIQMFDIINVRSGLDRSGKLRRGAGVATRKVSCRINVTGLNDDQLGELTSPLFAEDGETVLEKRRYSFPAGSMLKCFPAFDVDRFTDQDEAYEPFIPRDEEFNHALYHTSVVNYAGLIFDKLTMSYMD